MRCILPWRLTFSILLVLVLGVRASPALPPTDRTDTALTVTDSVYNANHPRLLYSPDEIPALFAKVRDGGNDDLAYSFIRLLIQYIYPGSSPNELLAGDFGLGTIPNLGIGSVLESPPDTAARDTGRALTLYIAQNWGPDTNAYDSSLRLRALALGYDMFFEDSDEAERTVIRDEILAYVDMMLTHGDYSVWPMQPYVGNISMMIASALGLAAICLDGETDSSVVQEAIDRADNIIQPWLTYQVDEGGTYNEGALYGSWSMRHLVYYFWARVRYDGYDFSAKQKIRNMEKWFVFELHPDGGAAVNNIQDCSYLDLPLAKHTTYFDWAQTAWGSRLSAYIWEHVAGAFGHNSGADADKAGTVIWNQNLPPEQPDSVLAHSTLWDHRGLYYFRTGWTAGDSSDDVLFSFYSGKFQGAHAQEDQNQFTLYGYGAHFAIDHGPGADPKQSEAHNMVFIDGKGQHNAGSSIGTDGAIRTYLLNGYADYLMGDATEAYTTHSPLNNPSFPYPGADWSWGYSGENPVDHAYRSVFVVRDPDTPPYFIIIDDIDKDGSPHTYQWRLHTGRDNSIDTTANPVHIADGDAFMDLHVLNPPFSSLTKTITYFNNLVPDPDSNILALSTTAVNPQFAFLMIPGDGSVVPPAVSTNPQPWGMSVVVEWSTGDTDLLLVNRSGGIISHPIVTSSPEMENTGARSERDRVALTATTGDIETDAGLALIRFDGLDVKRYLLDEVSTFSANGTDFVTINNGAATIGFSGTVIDIDRHDADFALYAPGVSDVFCRKQRIHVVEAGGYLTPDPVASIPGGTRDIDGIRVRAYPNPLNPTTTVAIELQNAATVNAAVYDAKGRFVKRLWAGPLPAGLRTLRWNGDNEAGARVASGVYFVVVNAGSHAKTLKLVVIK